MIIPRDGLIDEGSLNEVLSREESSGGERAEKRVASGSDEEAVMGDGKQGKEKKVGETGCRRHHEDSSERPTVMVGERLMKLL